MFSGNLWPITYTIFHIQKLVTVSATKLFLATLAYPNIIWLCYSYLGYFKSPRNKRFILLPQKNEVKVDYNG